MNHLLDQARAAGRLEGIIAADRPDLHPGYPHWDKLRYLMPPAGLTHEECWLALKIDRRKQYRDVPLRDAQNRRFVYALVDPIPELCHRIDMQMGGTVGLAARLTNPETKAQYIVRSLVEEAITSSLVEGAATTRERAREMLRAGRKPRDQAERMIVNNYETMEQISKLRKEPLTPELVGEIHRWITRDTLQKQEDAGRLRTPDRTIDVGDDFGQVFHTPPPAEQLSDRMKAMCDFANDESPQPFVHPVIRSMMLHFWLAYDHPFVDGNGRTARALFYWSMLRRGYWLTEYISISQIILLGPSKYVQAYLYTETDENDLTYFVLYHLDVVWRSVGALFEYLDRKAQELRSLERELRGLAELNHRQQGLLGHALRHPGYVYTATGHQRSHGVVPQTARTDLLDLVERGLLEKRKVGRQWRFTPVADLEERLRGE